MPRLSGDVPADEVAGRRGQPGRDAGGDEGPAAGLPAAGAPAKGARAEGSPSARARRTQCPSFRMPASRSRSPRMPMFASGSPSTIRRSAALPGSTVPVTSRRSRSSAALLDLLDVTGTVELGKAADLLINAQTSASRSRNQAGPSSRPASRTPAGRGGPACGTCRQITRHAAPGVPRAGRGNRATASPRGNPPGLQTFLAGHGRPPKCRVSCSRRRCRTRCRRDFTDASECADDRRDLLILDVPEAASGRLSIAFSRTRRDSRKGPAPRACSTSRPGGPIGRRRRVRPHCDAADAPPGTCRVRGACRAVG